MFLDWNIKVKKLLCLVSLRNTGTNSSLSPVAATMRAPVLTTEARTLIYNLRCTVRQFVPTTLTAIVAMAQQNTIIIYHIYKWSRKQIIPVVFILDWI